MSITNGFKTWRDAMTAEERRVYEKALDEKHARETREREEAAQPGYRPLGSPGYRPSWMLGSMDRPFGSGTCAHDGEIMPNGPRR